LQRARRPCTTNKVTLKKRVELSLKMSPGSGEPLATSFLNYISTETPNLIKPSATSLTSLKT